MFGRTLLGAWFRLPRSDPIRNDKNRWAQTGGLRACGLFLALWPSSKASLWQRGRRQCNSGRGLWACRVGASAL